MLYKYNKDKLMFEESSISVKMIKGFGMIVGFFVISSLIPIKSHKKINVSEEQKIIVIKEYNEFSEKKLIEKIKDLNFKFPHIILAQAKLESGNYKSIVFLENNNLFGMRQAKTRINISKGTNRQHAYYDSWHDSVVDYALYYACYLKNLNSEEQYFDYLRQNYAENSYYVNKLKEIIVEQNLKSKFN
jgi:uncharacterized FlgJ-related protein